MHQNRIKERQKAFVANKKLQGDIIKSNENEQRDHFIKRVLEQNHQVIREMNHLKGALTDYIYDNFNKSKQRKVLKQSEPNNGIPLPLKDAQIKVAERNQILIKQGPVIGEGSLKISATGSPIKCGTRAGVDKFGMPKKENFKEYDLKTN